LNIFNKLRNYPARVQLTPVARARNFYPRPSLENLLRAMETSLSFIVARNPFERLVSAYRDKIVNAFPGSEHDLLRRVCTHYKILLNSRLCALRLAVLLKVKG
jgi:hypothetical protein